MFKKHAAIVISFLFALFLDTAVLPKWNLFGLVPFVMLALMLACEQVFSLQTGILVGALGGLIEDLIAENMIGLTPALCLFAAVAYEKMPRNSDTKALILGAYCMILAFALELARALIAYVIGMRFDLMNAMLYGVLPRALLTGAWALGYMALFKPLLKRQVDAA